MPTLGIGVSTPRSRRQAQPCVAKRRAERTTGIDWRLTFVGLAAVAASSIGAISAQEYPAQQVADSVSPGEGVGVVRGEDSGVRGPVLSRGGARTGIRVSDAGSKRLRQLLRDRGAALRTISSQADSRAREIAADRWALPLREYRLTGRFGDRSYLWSTFHTGLDFAAPSGTLITAVAAGRVTDARWAGSYGYRTVITADDGTEFWYCHQTAINVGFGQAVTVGQTIGTVGATGNVTGPHLHLEIRPGGGDPVDPYAALAHHGLTP